MTRTIAMLTVLQAAATLRALAPGDLPPAVTAKNQDGKTVDLAELYGRRPVVLFFYPKSFTPGCTVEVKAFRDVYDELKGFDAAVFGISQDEQATQRRFCDEHKLAYDLLVDEGGAVATAFGIPFKPGFHSRQTVVVGRAGRVILVDADVDRDIEGHPKRVLAALARDWKDFVGGFKRLFNGKNLEGWLPVQAAADTWTVRNGVLECTGTPTCYIRTTESYKDYALLVEFKYTTRLGNAGLLVHINGPDKVWPKSIEPNLNAGQFGKFYLIGGATIEHGKDNPIRSLDVKVGEWNRFEVICKADTIRVLLNGELVNEGKKADPSSGFIGVQSEGVPIHFRTIAIRSLTVPMKR